MTTDEVAVMICATCNNAVDRYTDDTGLTYIHTPQDPDDHPVVPIRPGTDWRGRCDFCSHWPAQWRLPARSFTIPGNTQHGSEGSWAACNECARLIERNQWTAVIRRCLAHTKNVHPTITDAELDQYQHGIGALYKALRKHITGSLTPLGEGE